MTSQKNKTLCKIISAAVTSALLVTCLASCGISQRYSRYDRTGERYDYDLTEYISIPEYKGIEIPDLEYTATDEEVADNIYKKLAYFADETVITDGVVEKYDLVVADYTCTIDGVEFRELCSWVNESYRNFMAGINCFMVPEIDEAILGMAPGETKKITFTFSEPYYKDPTVSGLEAEFEITVEKIRRQDFPEYDDEFVSYYYGAESADAYTDEIKTQLEHDIESALEDYEVNLTWEYIVSNSNLKKIPSKEFKEMNDYETSYYISLAKSENMTLAEYATEELGYETVNDFYDAISEYSRDAVRDEMILYIIARCENITVDDAEYEDAVLEAASQYEVTDLETAKQVVVSEYGSEERYRSIVLLDKVYKYIADSATKIDQDEYYANKAAGKYTVDPEAATGLSKTEILLIVVCSVTALIFIAVALLAFAAIKAGHRRKNAKKVQAELEEKRRIRREAKALKKKHYGDKKKTDADREDVTDGGDTDGETDGVDKAATEAADNAEDNSANDGENSR